MPEYPESYYELDIRYDPDPQPIKCWGCVKPATEGKCSVVRLRANKPFTLGVELNLPGEVKKSETFYLLLLNMTCPDVPAPTMVRPGLFKAPERMIRPEDVSGKISVYVNRTDFPDKNPIATHSVLLDKAVPCSDKYDLVLTDDPRGQLLKWHQTNTIEIVNESKYDIVCGSIEWYITYKTVK
nr:hypothetical protein [Candidatus Njordarchaeum guaymaensis]